MARPRRMGFILFLVLAVVLLVVPPMCMMAFAAPRAQSADGCAAAADMMIVARALAVEKVDRELGERVMRLVYPIDADSEPSLAAIMRTAYDPRNAMQPTDIASELFAVCMRSGGNMDSILGVDS